jgi:hypothetical protein
MGVKLGLSNGGVAHAEEDIWASEAGENSVKGELHYL